MKILFEQLQKAFIYQKGSDLLHFDRSIIATSLELKEYKKAITKITEFLYRIYYSKHDSETKIEQFQETTLETDDVFILLLSKIYSDKKQASEKWIVKEIVNENTFKVYKSGITLTIDKNIHLPVGEQSKKISKDDAVTILFSCHFPNISYGFYVYKSDEGEIDISSGVGRIYFNLRFEHAVDFTRELLNRLYEQKLKFDYKIFKTIRTQYRIDSAVLYFSLNDYKELKDIIFPYLLSNTHLFNDEVSVFHYPISKGVGFAEEPLIREENESYGLNRCKILAEVIYDSLDTLESTGIISCETFVKKFEQNNINPDKVYLNPNSTLEKTLNS